MRFQTSFFLFISVFSFCSEVPEAIQKAQEEALKNNKLILIYLGTEWCGGCKYYKQKYASDENLRRILKDQVTYVEIDGDTRDGGWVSRSFGEFGYPSFYFIDASLKKKYGMIGFNEVEFPRIVKNVNEGRNPVHLSLSQFEEEPHAFHAAEVAEWYVCENEFEEAIDWYEKAEKLNTDSGSTLLKDPDTSFLFDIQRCKGALFYRGKIDFTEFKASVDRAFTYEKIQPFQEIYLISRMYWNTLELENHRDIIKPYFDRLNNIDGTLITGANEKRRLDTMVMQKLIYEGKKKEALSLKIKSLPPNWKEDPRKIYLFLEWCATNETIYDEARALAVSVVSEFYDNPNFKNIHPYSSIAIVNLEGPEKGFDFFEMNLGEKYKSNAGLYNSIAWWCFKSKKYLDYGKKYARLGVSVASDSQQKAYVLDTLAEIEYSLGDTAEAKKHIREAITLIPDKKVYKDNLKKYETD